MSLRDAAILAVAVAEALSAPVVTRDGYWSELADQGLVRIKVIGF